MDCVVKAALLKNYRDTAASYLRIVRQMRLCIGTPASRFSPLRSAAFDCLTKVEGTQRVLQRHISEHHC